MKIGLKLNFCKILFKKDWLIWLKVFFWFKFIKIFVLLVKLIYFKVFWNKVKLLKIVCLEIE